MFPELEARLVEFVKGFGQGQGQKQGGGVESGGQGSGGGGGGGGGLSDSVILARAKELGKELGIDQEALRFSDGAPWYETCPWDDNDNGDGIF
ncbi:hypothetical protein BGZ91_010217, partial [Linnemannia elongata]